jgi:putative transposase
LIPCWSGEVLSVAFAIDCHDREVLASVASPRPLAGTQIRTLMDRALWARFGEATLKAPHAIQWLSDNGLSARGVGCRDTAFLWRLPEPRLGSATTDTADSAVFRIGERPRYP